MRLFLLLTLIASAAAAQERQLVDEVVAVVDAHSVTLSELAAQLRDSELDEAWKAQGGQGDREALRLKLSKEKYERMLTELLAELRRRANVRIVDPLDDATRSVAERP